jgi:MFS transporter, DHA3 family, macrolide efflux protein
MAISQSETEPQPKGSLYLRALRNRAFVLLWTGSTVSTVGDTFFNLAVVWIIFAQSHSALQTSLIQVVWQVDKILFGPLAGVLADRWDRKRLMVITNILQALVVGALAVVFTIHGSASPVVIFTTVFLLNTLYTFSGPASAAIWPEVVGRDLLTTASGLSSAASQVAYIVGSALGGIVVAVAGAAGALMGDAISFLYATLSITIARLPVRSISTTDSSSPKKRASLLREFIEGWRALRGQPVVWGLTWLLVLLNVVSFLGPLWVVLISQRLHGGAVAYGVIEAVGVVGGIIGGLLAGPVERRIAAGYLVIVSWSLGGLFNLGIAFSTSLLLTGALVFIGAIVGAPGSVALGALMTALIPDDYRGRVAGITRALIAAAIPLSALIAGWLTDRIGVVPLFAIAGVWLLGTAVLAWSNRYIRTARL